MIAVRLPLLLSLAAAPAAAVAQRVAPAQPERRVTVTVQQQMIIRVPRLPVGRMPSSRTSSPPPPPIRWVEKKSDKCVPVINLAAAAITGTDSVDLVLNGGKRLRARFGSDCPALDFYSGFYVKMTADGKVCARRDSIKSRSGGECRIESFRALVPAR